MLKKDFEVIVIFLYGLSSTLRLTKRKEKKRKTRGGGINIIGE
jgi:hypothetical protein